MPQIQNIYPLSPMQEGMLFHNILDPASAAYFEQVVYRLQGHIDIQLFEKSFSALVQHHDILRTIFRYSDMEQPVQVVMDSRKAQIHSQDISTKNPVEQENFIRSFIESEKNKGFDLSRDLLIRISIIQTGPQNYTLIWSSHHILMDGWCIALLMQDFFKIYEAYKAGTEPVLEKPYPYSDYIQWLGRQDRQKTQDYWTNYLLGYENNGTGIPSLKKQDAQSYDLQKAEFSLDKISDSLRALAKAQGVTLNSVFQAAWALLLHKYSSSDDVLFGSVVSGRPAGLTGVEHMVGLFINTVPLRVKLEGNLPFNELLEQLHKSNSASTPYEYSSLADIQSHSQQKQGLLDHIFVFENYPVSHETASTGTSAQEDFRVLGMETFEQTNYDLNVLVSPQDSIHVKIQFNGHVYGQDVIERLAGHYKQVLTAIAADPQQLVSDLQMLGEEEKEQILAFSESGLNPGFLSNDTLIALFHEQVEQTPDNTAIICGDIQLTYKELNEQAKVFAQSISSHIYPGQVVAVVLERNHLWVAAMLGVLKTGTVYLPIDPAYPAERIQYMLSDSKAVAAISHSSIAEKTAFEGVTVFADKLPQGDNGLYRGYPDDGAYLIYTSGSTGQPKGVLCIHSGLVNMIHDQLGRLNIQSTDRILQFASCSFDASLYESFMALFSGAALVIADKETIADTGKFVSYLRDKAVTVATLPPVYLKSLDKAELPTLKTIITAGEAPVMDDVIHYTQKQHKRYINAYGPTEASVCVSTYEVQATDLERDFIPIGKPIANTGLYVLDNELNLLPIGVAGELCIAGAGLAIGYKNKPELTAGKFIDHPFQDDEYLYRSGDLARWLPDGSLQYLGRKDEQVKIRGYRIEPGEIEKTIAAHPAIGEALVMSATMGENTELIAFYTSKSVLEQSELKAYLQQQLPAYMVPAYFMAVTVWPLTPNGKTDRKALLAELQGSAGSKAKETVLPGNELEEKVLAVWQQLLGLQNISIHDNFFDIGGTSIKLIRLHQKLAPILGSKVSMADLFKYNTIAAICNALQEQSGEMEGVEI